MSDYEKLLNDHYGRPDLSARIVTAFEAAGKQIVSHQDTVAVDEFHIRGRVATRELADLAGMKKNVRVLDIGCGVGGPARTLAAEYGCRVTGVDVIEEFCEAATLLSRKVGLDHLVDFRHGDMTALPFGENSFDAAWSQHTVMNIENKADLFESIRRVLRPNGLFALFEICSGTVSSPHFPVPWASDSTINFLTTQDELRQMLEQAGFRVEVWNDVTAPSLAWYQKLVANMAARPSDAPARPGIDLVMGKDTAEKARNVARNLEENRITVVQAVLIT